MILLVVIVVRNYCRDSYLFFIAVTLEFLVNINNIKEIVVVTDTQRVENINQTSNINVLKALLFNYELNILAKKKTMN